MEINIISKKTMRNKDFSALKEKKRGYKRFKAPLNVVKHRFESLFRTPRGWFLTYHKIVKKEDGEVKKEKAVGEVSVTTAERWLRECNIRYSMGW